MIPKHDSATGALPPGDYQATWTEVTERYGWGVRRRKILHNLDLVLASLSEEVDVVDVYLDGSFTSDKERPSDVDVIVNAQGDIPSRWTDRAKHQERKKRWMVDLWFWPAFGAHAGGPLTDIKSFMASDAQGRPTGFIHLFEDEFVEGEYDDQE